MNKLLTKIVGVALGATMAIGVGVAVANSDRGMLKANAAEVTDTLVASSFAATNTTYTNFSGVSFDSDAVYAGNNGKTSSGGIQLRSKNSNSGIVTTTSGGTLKSISITVESGSNTLDVYGKTSAYSSAADLYSSSTQGTKIGSASTTSSITLTNPSNYSYVGLRSNNGALYLTSIVITWTTSGGSSDKLGTPSPSFDRATNTITWSAVTGATSYELKVDDGAYSAQSSGYSVASVSLNDAHTVSVVAKASGKTDSDAGTVTFHRYATKGTSTDPYTVADARRAIDNNDGVSSVYVSGIVSSISEEYSAQHSNISFDIVDALNDSAFVRAYRCSGTDAENVAVGDTALVSGTLTYYQSQSLYEFNSGCVLQSLEHAQGVEHTVSFVNTDGSTSPTSQQIVDGLPVTSMPDPGTYSGHVFTGWSSDGGTTYYQPGKSSGNISGDTTFTAYWQTKGTESTPYTVTEALTAITNNAGVVGVCVQGIITEDEISNLDNGKLTYYISVDGTSSNKLEVYKGKGLNNANFEAKTDLAAGATVVVYGDLIDYNTTKEFATGNYLKSYTAPASVTYTVTYTAGSNGTGSYNHTEQSEGNYTLLAFANLSDVSANSGYRFKNYTVGGVDKNPGDTITLNAATTVTVNFEVAPSGTTVSTTIADYASTNGWVNSTTQYLTVVLNPVTLTASGGGNTGKYYSNDESWRLYSSSNDTLTISVPSGCTLVNATLTFSGTMTYGGNSVSSGNEVSLSGTSAVFTVTANVKITEISVTYSGTPSVTTFTVTYDANGGDGTMTDSNSPYNANTSVTTLTNTFTRTGYTFAHWNTASDGTGTSYDEGVSFNISGNITLYAIWDEESSGSVTAARCYHQVTDVSDLVAGAKYIITNDIEALGGFYAMSTNQKSNNRGITEISSNGSIAAVSVDDAQVITLGGSTGAWTLGVDGGYLYAASSTANHLKTQAENDANGEWAITFNDGVASIVAQGTNSRKVMQFNSASSLVACYASASQDDLYLYRLDFSETLLHNITCDGNGSYTIASGYSWSDLKGVYQDLPSVEQTSLKTASTAGLARYDYLIAKYGTSTFENFIGRTITPLQSSRTILLGLAGNNAAVSTVVIILSMLTLTAVGGYFFMRKKKEQ